MSLGGDYMDILPELPKGKNRKEAKVDGRVAEWFLHNWPRVVAIEVKVVGGTTKPHQENFLRKMANKLGFKYKFRDGGLRTPCDYIVFPIGVDVDAVLATCDGNHCECIINGKDLINIKV